MSIHIPTPPTPKLALENEPHFLCLEEVPQVALFDWDMFPFPHLPEPYKKTAEAYWANQVENHPTSTEVITAAGEIAAYMHIALQDSQNRPGRKYAELLAVAVAPQYRRQGIASFLASRAMHRALDNEDVIAFRTFGEDGSPMINTALQIGFTKSSRIPVWRKDASNKMHAGYFFDLLVPQNS